MAFLILWIFILKGKNRDGYDGLRKKGRPGCKKTLKLNF